MFQAAPTDLGKQVAAAESAYVIRKNDQLTIRIYTNSGERLIDPDFELMKETPPQADVTTLKPDYAYLVLPTGEVKLPMVGNIKVEGLTVREAEDVLQKAFSEFYENPFAVVKITNHRVVVLGAPKGQVIPLENQNTTLAEILALAEGIGNDADASNIRVLRGDDVIVADFSTVEGYRRSNIVLHPGDIVYVEPIRRPVAESIRDYAPLVTILTSLTTLIVVLIGL
ncbi:MAG TPA: polysaccharide biosynthesis/export family protein [Ohtaekwangia sp.]|nr:polysaccharide biosynthesis/export family protein [Ohtaekwangia sp.]